MHNGKSLTIDNWHLTTIKPRIESLMGEWRVGGFVDLCCEGEKFFVIFAHF